MGRKRFVVIKNGDEVIHREDVYIADDITDRQVHDAVMRDITVEIEEEST